MHEETGNAAERGGLKRTIVKALKIFCVFLLLFAIFMLIASYQIHSLLVYGFSGFDSKKSGPDVGALPEHPLQKYIAGFLKCESYLPDDYDRKKSIIKNIEKAIDGKFEISAKKKANFVSANRDLRKIAFEMAEGEPDSAEVSVPDIPETFEVLFNLNYDYAGLHEKTKIMAILTRLALNDKDYISAMKFDLALMRLARASAVGQLNYPTLVGVLIQNVVLDRASRTPAETYLSHDELFADTAAVSFMRKALASRVSSLGLLFGLESAFRLEGHMIRAANAKRRKAFPWTMAFLDFFYGKAEGPILSYIGELTAAPRATFREQFAVTKRFEERYYGLIGGSGPNAIFLRPLRVNPLMTHMPDFSGIFHDFASLETRGRLATLGGLARLFHFDNGRWPDLSKDKDFAASAGPAAVDPLDGAAMRFRANSDGTMTFYSVGVDCADNGGDKKKDLTINVKAPTR